MEGATSVGRGQRRIGLRTGEAGAGVGPTDLAGDGGDWTNSGECPEVFTSLEAMLGITSPDQNFHTGSR